MGTSFLLFSDSSGSKVNSNLTSVNDALNNKANASDIPNKGVYVGNLNDIPVAANALTIWLSDTASTNSPVAVYGLVETIYIGNSSHAIQRFTSWEATPRLFVRRKNSGTWGSWVEK